MISQIGYRGIVKVVDLIYGRGVYYKQGDHWK
jgi:hypothetical protein